LERVAAGGEPAVRRRARAGGPAGPVELARERPRLGRAQPEGHARRGCVRGRYADDRRAWRGHVGLNAADRAVAVVGEPEGAVRPGRNSTRAIDAGIRVRGDRTAGADPLDRLVAVVREPEGAVRPGRDRVRAVDAVAAVVGDRAAGGDPPDRVVAV